MKMTETEEKLAFYPDNLHNSAQLLKTSDVLLGQKSLRLSKNLVAVDREKAVALDHAFKNWVTSSKKFEFAKRIHGHAFPLALAFTLLLGILTIPVMLIAPLLPSELLMLIATPICALLTLPQICVLIDVYIDKFIDSRRKNMGKFSGVLDALYKEVEKKFVVQGQELVCKKKEHCIVEGFEPMTQYGTLFSYPRAAKNQKSLPANTHNVSYR